jgi:hypothetical protein
MGEANVDQHIKQPQQWISKCPWVPTNSTKTNQEIKNHNVQNKQTPKWSVTQTGSGFRRKIYTEVINS